MVKYKFLIFCQGEEIFDSYNEYGDDDFEGTFRSADAARDAASYYISCAGTGGEIMKLMGDQDVIYDVSDYDYLVEEIIF